MRFYVETLIGNLSDLVFCRLFAFGNADICESAAHGTSQVFKIGVQNMNVFKRRVKTFLNRVN
ncbi:hypothetical protein D3C71_2062800 [compost metagenome]